MKNIGVLFHGPLVGFHARCRETYRIPFFTSSYRVAVHPKFFRMGIAGKLVNYVENIQNNINKIVVCTGRDNLPAVNLYLKNGFQKIKDIEISKDIYLTQLEKIL